MVLTSTMVAENYDCASLLVLFECCLCRIPIALVCESLRDSSVEFDTDNNHIVAFTFPTINRDFNGSGRPQSGQLYCITTVKGESTAAAARYEII
jgi:hypothetical protein